MNNMEAKSASTSDTRTSLQKLIDEPKGKTTYTSGEAFLLHVFWEAPSLHAASELLEGLRQCAASTHRDTPCTPIYYFRVSTNNDDLAGPIPRTVREYSQLSDALRKLRVGVARHAVVADLVRRGLDANYIDLDLDDTLPLELAGQKPVMLEFTELYLDERAFMEHAGSREYLDGYGIVMKLQLQTRVPTTIRCGTPNDSMIEKILDPILKEVVIPQYGQCMVWNTPAIVQHPVMMSLDLQASVPSTETEAASIAEALPQSLITSCAVCLVYPHPLRSESIRVFCVFPTLPSTPILSHLSSLRPIRCEVHTTADEANTDRLREELITSGLGMAHINKGLSSGYILHPLAASLRTIS